MIKIYSQVATNNLIFLQQVEQKDFRQLIFSVTETLDYFFHLLDQTPCRIEKTSIYINMNQSEIYN
jgi:hypothetical protein